MPVTNKKILTICISLALACPVTDVLAAPLLTEDDTPQVFFDDTSATDEAQWILRGTADDDSGNFALWDNVGTNNHPVININTNADSSAIQGSILVQDTGNMRLALDTIWIARSAQAIGIGVTEYPTAGPELILQDTQPYLLLRDETDNSEGYYFLDNGMLSLGTKPGAGALRLPFRINVNATGDSVIIDDTGTLIANNNVNTPGLLLTDTSLNGTPGMAWLNDETNLFGVLNDSVLTYSVLLGNANIYNYSTMAPTGSLTIDPQGNAGFGTLMPTQAVDVQRSGAAARFQLTSFTNTGTEAPQYIQRRSRGTAAAPEAVQDGDNLGLFSFRGYNGTTMGGSRATITAQAAGNFTDTSTPTRLIFATTPVGQTVPQQVLVITPDGKVQVNGSALNVPDYVFEDGYELMPLEELQSFIDNNGHLPGIAPAHEVNAEGLDLAGSQMGQLQKIEELTLYTLEQERRLVALDAENRSLREELAALRSGLDEVRRLNGLD